MTTADARKWRDALKDNNTNNNTINAHLGAVRQVIERAFADQLRTENGIDFVAFKNTDFGTDVVLDFVITAAVGMDHDVLDFHDLRNLASSTKAVRKCYLLIASNVKKN